MTIQEQSGQRQSSQSPQFVDIPVRDKQNTGQRPIPSEDETSQGARRVHLTALLHAEGHRPLRRCRKQQYNH
jgi:hypothetical protein